MALPRLVARAVALCSMGAVVACSALVGFDGFVGSDLSVDAHANDSSAGDTNLGSDANHIAPVDAAADSTLGFCAGQTSTHAFCSDFENVASATEGWTQAFINMGGSITLDPLGSNSSTSASMDLADAGCAYSRLVKDFPTASSSLTSAKLSFDVRPGNSAASGDFNGGYIGLIEAGECKFMFYGPTSGNARFLIQEITPDASEFNDNFELTAPAPLGMWSRAEIDVTFTGAPSVTVSIDGNVVGGPHAAFADCATSAPLSIDLGFYCSTGPQEARIDNVLFDYE